MPRSHLNGGMWRISCRSLLSYWWVAAAVRETSGVAMVRETSVVAKCGNCWWALVNGYDWILD